MSTFDPHLEASGTVFFKGEYTKMQCVDPAATFAPLSQANLVMNGSQPFSIELEWQLSGPLAPLWLAALGGSWTVEAFAESIGPGPEIQIASANGGSDPSLVVNPGTLTYSTTLQVLGGTLPEGNPGATGPSGQYKISCSAFLNSTLGPPGYDITGYVEGPIIRIENPI